MTFANCKAIEDEKLLMLRAGHDSEEIVETLLQKFTRDLQIGCWESGLMLTVPQDLDALISEGPTNNTCQQIVDRYKYLVNQWHAPPLEAAEIVVFEYTGGRYSAKLVSDCAPAIMLALGHYGDLTLIETELAQLRALGLELSDLGFLSVHQILRLDLQCAKMAVSIFDLQLGGYDIDTVEDALEVTMILSDEYPPDFIDMCATLAIDRTGPDDVSTSCIEILLVTEELRKLRHSSGAIAQLLVEEYHQSTLDECSSKAKGEFRRPGLHEGQKDVTDNLCFDTRSEFLSLLASGVTYTQASDQIGSGHFLFGECAERGF